MIDRIKQLVRSFYLINDLSEHINACYNSGFYYLRSAR